MIYFVRDTATGAIKIGFSLKPWTRFSKIQSDSPAPLDLLCVLHGEKADEAALHVRFSHLRSRGEWFADDGEIVKYVDEQIIAGASVLRVVRAISENGLCVTALSRQLGISQPYASQVLGGKRCLSGPKLARAWKERGWKIGLLEHASDADCDAFVRIIEGAAPKHAAAA